MGASSDPTLAVKESFEHAKDGCFNFSLSSSFRTTPVTYNV